MEQCSLPSDLSKVETRKSIKEIPMVHEGWPVVWTPFCFASLRMLNNNRCGFNQLELSGLSTGLSGSPSVSSFSSGKCGNAILQYCYGFNRLS